MAATTTSTTLIEETPGNLRIVMPTPRIGCVAAFLGVWMLGWAAGEFSALRALFSLLLAGAGAASIGGAAFMLFWLAGWTAGGVVCGFIFLMMLDGREIITLGDGILRRRVEAFRWGLSWRYPLERCSNLRRTGNSEDSKTFISFDYTGPKGDKTIRFGTGLTETAAQQVAEKTWAAFPQLMPRLERSQREKRATEDAVAPGTPTP